MYIINYSQLFLESVRNANINYLFIPNDDDRDEFHDNLVQHHEEVHHQFAAWSYLTREHAKDNAKHNHAHHVRAIFINQSRF